MINNKITTINNESARSFLQRDNENVRIKITKTQHRCVCIPTSTESKLANLIERFEIINPKLSHQLKLKYFGYFDNENEKLVKILNNRKLNRNYNTLLRVYDNCIKLKKLIDQLGLIDTEIAHYLEKEYFENEILEKH